MGKSGKTVIYASIIALFLIGSLAVPAMGEGTGIGLAPYTIQIDNALRGADYDRSLVITNMGQMEMYYAIAAEGEAATWLSYYYNGAAVDKVPVPALSDGIFEVKISVPEDAVNGEHKATVTVTSLPEMSSAGQATVAVAAVSYLDITVSGTQVIAGQVTEINTEDVEMGYPLKIQVFLQNTGNVEVSPLITANITKNGIPVGNVTKNDTKVRAGAGQFLIAEWDTTGNTEADYIARVSVALNGEDIATEDLPFKILPLGTLMRSGELKEIVVNGAAIVNLATKMTATFANTGQIDTWAEFTGEIYKGDQLVDTFTGEKLLIEKGSEGNLFAYFKLAETGEYTIKGWVIYEGKKTDVKEITFKVIEPQPIGNVAEATPTPVPTGNTAGEVITPITDKGMAAYWYIVMGLGGAAVIAAAYLFGWRRKQFVPVFVSQYNKVFKELGRNKLFKKIKIDRMFSKKRAKSNGKKRK
jgi:hypothetical protein